MFYRFLRMEERTTECSVDLLSSPTLCERIPQVLSPEDVDKLLAAPILLAGHARLPLAAVEEPISTMEN